MKPVSELLNWQIVPGPNQIAVIFDANLVSPPDGWDLMQYYPADPENGGPETWTWINADGFYASLFKLGLTPTGESWGYLDVPRLELKQCQAWIDACQSWIILCSVPGFLLAQNELEIALNNALYHAEPPCP